MTNVSDFNIQSAESRYLVQVIFIMLYIDTEKEQRDSGKQLEPIHGTWQNKESAERIMQIG